SAVKTEAPAASVYIYGPSSPNWPLASIMHPRSREWLFPPPRGPFLGIPSYLKPAAVRARVDLFVRRTRTGTAVETIAVNFQVSTAYPRHSLRPRRRSAGNL